MPALSLKAMYGVSMTMRMLALTLIAFIAACSDVGLLSDVKKPELEKPDLGATLVEASEQLKTGLKPRLLYERCEKLTPVVELIHQAWFCRFGSETSKGAQDCSAKVSLHAFDHEAIWLPNIGDIDLVTGKTKPNLACKRRPAAS